MQARTKAHKDAYARTYGGTDARTEGRTDARTHARKCGCVVCARAGQRAPAASAAPVQVLDALVTNAMHRSVRAAGLDLDTRRAAKGRYLDFGPEHRLGVGNVRFVMEVITVSLEAFVGLDAQVHEEPTVASPAYSRRSAIGQSHRRTVLYARWNLDRER